MASRPAIISRQAWENIECKNRQPHPATTTSRRWAHACKQPNTKSKLWVTRSRHELWATMSQMWKQLYQNGCNHSRQDYKGGSSNSTDVSPGDVETPPPVLLPSVHPPAKPSSNRAGGKHNFFTHFPKDPNCEVCRRTKVTRAPCKRHTDERADRKKMGERFGDMITADHKVLNEGQESRMHYKYRGLCKTWRLNGFKVIHAKPYQFRRRREISKHSYVERRTPDQIMRTILWSVLKPVTC